MILSPLCRAVKSYEDNMWDDCRPTVRTLYFICRDVLTSEIKHWYFKAAAFASQFPVNKQKQRTKKTKQSKI